MGQWNWAWFAAAGIAATLSACDDEIVDLGLSVDAAAERAPDASPDAPRNGADAATPDVVEPEDATSNGDESPSDDAASETGAAEAGDAPTVSDRSEPSTPSDASSDGVLEATSLGDTGTAED